jgi:hypothetical protein
VGDGRLHPRIPRHQVSPLGRVALEVLDRRPKRRIAAQREGLQEGQFALLRGLLGEEALHRPPRPRDEVRGSALDQEEQRIRASRRQAGQQPLAVEEPLERIRGHCRLRQLVRQVATCLYSAVTG